MKINILSKRISMRIFFIFVFVFIFSFSSFADWVKSGDNYMFINSATGQYVRNNWLQTGNGYYYFDANGLTVKGWYLINGKYFYFNNDGLMQTGFVISNDKTYYLNPETGEMVTGWIQTYVNGTVEYYYFDQDGSMVTKWKQIDGKWYYFNEGKAIVNTWAKINDLWYHFNHTGAMDTGWINQNGKMYYLNISNGSLQKGWIQDQYGNEYYLSDTDGSLVVNTTIQIAGTGYTFDETGKCIAKNQYSYGGTQYGNTGGVAVGVLGNKGQQTVYGVNIGISPGQNLIEGATTSAQQQIQASDLEPGSTEGPK